MKLITAATTILLVSTTIAAPSADERRRNAYQRRVARRNAAKSVGHSNLSIRANSTNPKDTTRLSNGDSFDTYGGAVYYGTGITQVSATSVNVPAVSIPPGGSPGTEYGGAAWVGIDGESCPVILQTGFEWTVSGNSGGQYAAWYQWYPETSHEFNITISEGDSISMSVVATSATGGTAYITNESTGQHVSQSLSNQPSLCQRNAEWIVEDFGTDHDMVPFAAFDTVTFSGATFTDSKGQHDTTGSRILEIQQDSILTSCHASCSTVQCKYQ